MTSTLAPDDEPRAGTTPAAGDVGSAPRCRTSRVGLTLFVVGTLGLGLGMLLYPDSNLLGGFALIFGPVQLVGAVILVVGWIACLVTRLSDRAK